MSIGKKIRYIMRNMNQKHRLSMRNQHSDQEVWYMHISPLNILAGLVALVLVLFVIITTTVAYTPLLDFIPGYPGNKSRELLIENIMKLDSLEQEINNMQIYSENIALIMEGKNPVTRHDVGADTISHIKTENVEASDADMALRRELETPGTLYSLSNTDDKAVKKLRSSLELFAPVKGVLQSSFNIAEGNYGVMVLMSSSQEVMAVMDGTIISSLWTPNDGYVIYLQHPDNMISVYKHNTTVLKHEGDRVRSGEVIAYTGRDGDNPSRKNIFEFELWRNGSPVDPQQYIMFN